MAWSFEEVPSPCLDQWGRTPTRQLRGPSHRRQGLSRALADWVIDFRAPETTLVAALQAHNTASRTFPSRWLCRCRPRTPAPQRVDGQIRPTGARLVDAGRATPTPTVAKTDRFALLQHAETPWGQSLDKRARTLACIPCLGSCRRTRRRQEPKHARSRSRWRSGVVPPDRRGGSPPSRIDRAVSLWSKPINA